MVLKTTSIAKWLFKSGAAPLYRSLVTSLHYAATGDMVECLLRYIMKSSKTQIFLH